MRVLFVDVVDDEAEWFAGGDEGRFGRRAGGGRCAYEEAELLEVEKEREVFEAVGLRRGQGEEESAVAERNEAYLQDISLELLKRLLLDASRDDAVQAEEPKDGS